MNKPCKEPEKLYKALQNIYSTARLLYDGASNGQKFTSDEIAIFINGMEICLKDIANHYGYDSILAKQVEERYKELKEVNRRNNELQDAVKKLEMNPQAVTAKLMLYQDVARAFYEAAGFHYGSMTLKERFLSMEMSGEYHKNPEPNLTSLRNLFTTLRNRMDTNSLLEFELVPESSYRDYMKDTPENRRRIIELLNVFLPGSFVTKFESRYTNGEWTLRYDVNVPYDVLDSLYKAYDDENKQERSS